MADDAFARTAPQFIPSLAAVPFAEIITQHFPTAVVRLPMITYGVNPRMIVNEGRMTHLFEYEAADYVDFHENPLNITANNDVKEMRVASFKLK